MEEWLLQAAEAGEEQDVMTNPEKVWHYVQYVFSEDDTDKDGFISYEEMERSFFRGVEKDEL